jgi:hypothetical protein
MQPLLGALIGAGFGAIFVLVNAGDPVPSPVGTTLRVLAGAALLVVLALSALLARKPVPPHLGRNPDGRPMFGRGYRLIVVAEVVLLAAGMTVIRLIDAPPQANVAWIATVVGAHFLALAAVWAQRSIAVVGGVQTVLGLTGLVLLATPAAAWVPLISGVLSGATLLAGSLAFSVRAFLAARPTDAALAESTQEP